MLLLLPFTCNDRYRDFGDRKRYEGPYDFHTEDELPDLMEKLKDIRADGGHSVKQKLEPKLTTAFVLVLKILLQKWTFVAHELSSLTSSMRMRSGDTHSVDLRLDFVTSATCAKVENR